MATSTSQLPAIFRTYNSFCNASPNRNSMESIKLETIKVSSWQEFTDLSLALDGWAFRGQQDANWLLQSSLARYLSSFVHNASNWRVQEQRAIRIFRRKAHTYIADARVLSDDLRCLGLMQHHARRQGCSILPNLPT